MKRFITIAALVLAAAPFASATVQIQKDAKAKNSEVKCLTCHEKMPCTKTNLTAEGKKWVPAAKK